jgi:hypothetical protein
MPTQKSHRKAMLPDGLDQLPPKMTLFTVILTLPKVVVRVEVRDKA